MLRWIPVIYNLKHTSNQKWCPSACRTAFIEVNDTSSHCAVTSLFSISYACVPWREDNIHSVNMRLTLYVEINILYKHFSMNLHQDSTFILQSLLMNTSVLSQTYAVAGITHSNRHCDLNSVTYLYQQSFFYKVQRIMFLLCWSSSAVCCGVKRGHILPVVSSPAGLYLHNGGGWWELCQCTAWCQLTAACFLQIRRASGSLCCGQTEIGRAG